MLMSLFCTQACFGWKKTHLIPLPRSQTPPLARKRGRGRNIFLSCSVHSAASNQSTTSSPYNQHCPPKALPSTKKAPTVIRGTFRGKNRRFLIFPLCRSSTAGDGGAAAGGGGASAGARAGGSIPCNHITDVVCWPKLPKPAPMVAHRASAGHFGIQHTLPPYRALSVISHLAPGNIKCLSRHNGLF